jgi:type I restriction enzyme R subunit
MAMAFLPEAAVEQALLDQLRVLGYNSECEEDIGPDGQEADRFAQNGSNL